MNLEARKIEFVQEFLKLQSEETLSRLALNKRINQSESDFRNNRFKSSSELLAKYE
jgi:hypothetical protein